MLDPGQPSQAATGRAVRLRGVRCLAGCPRPIRPGPNRLMVAGPRRGRIRRVCPERNGGHAPRVTYTRRRDLSGTLTGAGGIGGVLARSHGYSSGTWSSHNFYHTDGNGNLTALANSTGALQASYKYDPYGRWLSGAGSLSVANVLRFSSKPWVGFYGSATEGLCYQGGRLS